MSRLASGLDLGERPAFVATAGRQVLVGLGIVALLVLWLRLVGRPFACPCGTVTLFVADATSAENSQQFSDWYSALHVVFGLGLGVWLQRIRPHWPKGERLLVALASSAVWEAIENVPFVIALFGNAPGAPAYAGDSILNALADSLFVITGFLASRVLPLPATIALVVAVEIAVSLAINDGLVLGLLRMLGVSV